MQGLWSNRRAKVNLNSPAVPAPVSSSSAPKPEETNNNVETIIQEESQIAQSTSVNTTDVNDNPPESRPPNSGTKRKLRRTATNTDESSKRYKTSSSSSSKEKDYSPPSTRLSDLGGVSSCVEKMLELVAMPLCHPEIYLHTGVQPPRGVLLHGPPGCGKTLLANAIAGVSSFFHGYHKFMLRISL